MNDYQHFIHLSRYAKWLPKESRRETWNETVDRYIKFWQDKYPKAANYKELTSRILNLEVMPSMRCMMTAGEALERDHAAGYNCSYIALRRPAAFSEIMYILMCFAPETRVQTKKGLVAISELTTFDEVLSYCEESGVFEYIHPSLVTETPSKNREKVELEFDNGYIVKCTADHQFLTENRGWVEAQDLTEEDEIRNYHEIKIDTAA